MKKFCLLWFTVLLCMLLVMPVSADVSPLAIVGPLALLGLAVALAIGLICLCVGILIKVIRKHRQSDSDRKENEKP